ncbi:MAG: prephenate dehydrogenase/arogenate dehydrogenase family protein [Anaerolineae bacterium]|nr:prephenate dehydrogenase/arogenate dehydrogenase family protein [Anaerolineae bacterium]
MDLLNAQVTIVGMGLMGASLAGGLRGKCRCVVGAARRAESIEIALARGFIDRGTTDLAEGVREADVVVLATPVRAILRQLPEIASLLPGGCLLMDLGSTKGRIAAEMAQLPGHIQPLGGHPMCGKEKSGIEVADPALYQGCTFILSPLERTSQEALALGRALAEGVGARPLILEPERQDFLVATVSHLPYLLACALVATADATTSQDPAAWEVVATGFRSTSRLAGSDVTMMIDILLTNREEVLRALDTYQSQLCEVIRLVEDGDEEKMREVLGAIRKTRREMYPASQQVIE